METKQLLPDRRRAGRVNPACYNLAKGIAMAAIVYSHSIGHFAVHLSRSLQVMALPLRYVGFGAVMVFYLVTGMTLPDKLPRLKGKKTAKELLLPYLWVALAYCVLYAPIQWLFGMEWERAVKVALQYAAAFALGVPQAGQTVGGFTMTWCTAAWYFLAAFWGIHLVTAIGRQEKRWVRALLLLLCEAGGLWLIPGKACTGSAWQQVCRRHRSCILAGSCAPGAAWNKCSGRSGSGSLFCFCRC